MQFEAQNGPLGIGNGVSFGVSVNVQPDLSKSHHAEPYGKVSLQEQRFWLKLLASWNMLSIFVTKLVSQVPIAWLKLLASQNMKLMSVTELVSQSPIGSLKLDLPLNKSLMSVIPPTHHEPIG